MQKLFPVEPLQIKTVSKEYKKSEKPKKKAPQSKDRALLVELKAALADEKVFLHELLHDPKHIEFVSRYFEELNNFTQMLNQSLSIHQYEKKIESENLTWIELLEQAKTVREKSFLIKNQGPLQDFSRAIMIAEGKSEFKPIQLDSTGNTPKTQKQQHGHHELLVAPRVQSLRENEDRAEGQGVLKKKLKGLPESNQQVFLEHQSCITEWSFDDEDDTQEYSPQIVVGKKVRENSRNANARKSQHQPPLEVIGDKKPKTPKGLKSSNGQIFKKDDLREDKFTKNRNQLQLIPPASAPNSNQNLKGKMK